jgi:hypothetical protein
MRSIKMKALANTNLEYLLSFLMKSREVWTSSKMRSIQKRERQVMEMMTSMSLLAV